MHLFDISSLVLNKLGKNVTGSDDFEDVLTLLCEKYRVSIAEYYLMLDKKFLPHLKTLLNSGKFRFERIEASTEKRGRRGYPVLCPGLLTVEDMMLPMNLRAIKNEYEELMRNKSGELDYAAFMPPDKSRGKSDNCKCFLGSHINIIETPRKFPKQLFRTSSQGKSPAARNLLSEFQRASAFEVRFLRT